jgi:hypothetical protein
VLFDFVSGPGGIASALRRTLLGAQLNGKSIPLDAGYSDHIPEAIRRAVIRRGKHCAWPAGCDRPAVSDVHHTTHKKDGGPTSTKDCMLRRRSGFRHAGWRVVAPAADDLADTESRVRSKEWKAETTAVPAMGAALPALGALRSPGVAEVSPGRGQSRRNSARQRSFGGSSLSSNCSMRTGRSGPPA